VDEIMEETKSVKNLVVIKHADLPVEMQDSRDIWWHEIIKDMDTECSTEQMDSEDPYLFYIPLVQLENPKVLSMSMEVTLLGCYTTLKFVF